MNKRDLDSHVTILGWLHILSSAFILVMGGILFIFLTSIGAISGDAEAMRILPIVGAITLFFMGAVALPGLIAGYGLLKRHSWGRILAIVVSFLGLLNFPIGTAIGIYSLVILLQEDANDYFAMAKVA